MCGCVATRLAFTNSMVRKRARGVGREDREALVRISKLGRNVKMYSGTLKSATGSRGLHVETNYLEVWSPGGFPQRLRGGGDFRKAVIILKGNSSLLTPEGWRDFGHQNILPGYPPSSLVPLGSFIKGLNPGITFREQ